MIKPREIYTFQDPYIAAASGLVLAGKRFYLVADDENSILGIDRDLKTSAEVYQVFPGVLPEDKKERKKLKPDFECLVHLPDLNSLLCIPSGSKKNRTRGALVDLSNHKITEVSFKHVFQKLEELFPELNIEGAVLLDEQIRLFQRGNGKLHQNAVIDLDLKSFLADEIKGLVVKNIALGTIKEIRLSFTDATMYQNKCYFIAVAENSESTYADGEYVGAVLGEMSKDGEVLSTTLLDLNSKPEGLAIDEKSFYLVTDDDDRKKPSRLFQGTLPVN